MARRGLWHHQSQSGHLRGDAHCRVAVSLAALLDVVQGTAPRQPPARDWSLAPADVASSRPDLDGPGGP